MNYTNKYHLPQWEKSDRVLMEDFNQMCLDMAAGLDAVSSSGSTAAANAQKTADTALSAANAARTAADNAASAAANAQKTADTALSAANAAQSAANYAYTPDNQPFVAGTYIGNGTMMVIELGFRPSFAVISGQFVQYGEYKPDFALAGPNITETGVTFTDSGMSIRANNTTYTPNVNADNHHYAYIAFR